MNTYADKTKESKGRSVATAVSQRQIGGESTFQFVDNRPEAFAQRKLQEMADNNLQTKMIPASALKTAAQPKPDEINLQNTPSNVFQLKKLTSQQESELPELKEEVDVLCEGYAEDQEEFKNALNSPYNIYIEGEEAGDLDEEVEFWRPKFDTFFRKLAMIPERAKTSQASFKRLKRQLDLWNNSLRVEYYEHVEQFWNIYREREGADNELTSEQRDDLTQINEADERYFRWYLNQNKSPLPVYRGDGRGVNQNSLDAFQFTHILPGGTRDISFRGVVEHTHTNTLKNGMVSMTSDFGGAHFWAAEKHKYGIVYEMRPANYIDVTHLLNKRNFKERYPGQYEILIPGAISASEVVSATLYQKDKIVKQVHN